MNSSRSLKKCSPELKYRKTDKLAVKEFISYLTQKNNSSPDFKIRLAELIDILRGPKFGYSLLKSIQLVRWLVDKEGDLVPVESRGLVCFCLKNNILSPFLERQQRLQDAILNLDDVATAWRDVLRSEQNELRQYEKLLPPPSDDEEQKNKRRFAK